MNLDDMWSDCCDYLEREGWGDLGLLKLENPEEYRIVYEFFEIAQKQYRESPDSFKGIGAVAGLGMVPPLLGEFYTAYWLAQKYEPGDPYRYLILSQALQRLLREWPQRRARPWGETKNMAYERLVFPRSVQLRGEKTERPDGADSAVSRAGREFRTTVWKEWRELTGQPPWILGITQYFLWQQGYVTEDESELANTTARNLTQQISEALDDVIEELKQSRPPGPEEWRVWESRRRAELEQESARNPYLVSLLLPDLLDVTQETRKPRRKRSPRTD